MSLQHPGLEKRGDQGPLKEIGRRLMVKNNTREWLSASRAVGVRNDAEKGQKSPHGQTHAKQSKLPG